MALPCWCTNHYNSEKRGRRIFTRGYITGNGRFFTEDNVMSHRPVGTLQSTAAVHLSCRYRELNYPFCCVHRSTDSQCFSLDWKPLKLPLLIGISTLIWYMVPWADKSPHPNGILIGSAVLAQHTCVRQTDTTHTDSMLRVISVAIGHIYALRVCNVA